MRHQEEMPVRRWGIPVEADPDPGWVAGLTGRSFEEAERAVAEIREDRKLQRELLTSFRRHGRAEYVQIACPFELYAIARLRRPRHIVEMGVSSGFSSSFLLRALERNRRGTLHSVDLPEYQAGPKFSQEHDVPWVLPPGATSGWAVPSGLKRRWDLRLGTSASLLPGLVQELPEIDLLLYDCPHSHAALAQEIDLAAKRFRPGSIVISDENDRPCRAILLAAKKRKVPAFLRHGRGISGFATR